MAVSTTKAPASWNVVSASPSHANAKTVAATGSNIAVIAARDAGICRKDAARSANGTIVPSTTIHAIKSQTGSERCSMRPSNEVVSSTSSRGNDDHGERGRGAERRGDAQSVQREAVPELDEQGNSEDRQRERRPDPVPHCFVVHQPGPEGDEHRCDVLDQQ